jgi:phosphohistidine phosphatase
MKLYLARHGQATSPRSDAPASLTAQGKTNVERVGLELARRSLTIQQIWYSPKTRTRQTAEIYAGILGIKPANLMEKNTLLIDAAVDLLYHDILESKINHLLLVSHEPLLNELSSFLVEDEADSSSIYFPTSGVAAFEQDPRWKWLWHLEPAALK